MIEPVLDPITTFEWEQGWRKYLCFAYANLAYYADSAFPARVLESFRRAWFHDSVTRVPGVPGGRPPFVVVPFSTNGANVLVVAIAGTTSLWQWVGLTDVPAFQDPVIGTPCRTATVYNRHASAIKAILDEDPDFLTAKNTAGWKVVFTGHSLGGALAEVLAKQYRGSGFYNSIYVEKFASPRVGDARFRDAWTRDILTNSYYLEYDPIDVFPFNANVMAEFADQTYRYPETLFVPDAMEFRIGRNGNGAFKPSVVQNANAVRLAAELVSDLAIDSLWRDHVIAMYRLALSNQLFPQNNLMKFRFLHWELPDNNAWGKFFVPDVEISAAMLGLRSPPPDDEPVPAVLLSRGMSGGGNWGDGGASATGDWGLSESGGRNGNIVRPEPRQVPFVRRQHRPIGGTHR